MIIKQDIEITDRASLMKVKSHLEHKCNDQRHKMQSIGTVFFEKWDGQRISYAILSQFTSRWMGQGIAAAVASLAHSPESDGEKQSSWKTAILNILSEFLPSIIERFKK